MIHRKVSLLANSQNRVFELLLRTSGPILIMIFLFSFSACAGEQIVTEDITIVNHPAYGARVNQAYRSRLQAVSNQTISYELKSGPTGMTVDPESGEIFWTPDEQSEFNTPVKILITSTDSLSRTLEFRINVAGLQFEAMQTDLLENQGFNRQLIEEAILQIRTGAYSGIHSFLVFRNGKLVLEEYFSGFTNDWPVQDRRYVQFSRETPHFQASVTKSIVSLLCGMAIDQGFITGVDDAAHTYFPEYGFMAMDEKRSITIRHLLTMSPGIDYGNPEWQAFMDRIYPTSDWLRTILEYPLASPPGQSWKYVSGVPHVLGALITKATGLSLEDFAKQHLLIPMDMKSFTWAHGPDGRAFGGGCHKMRPIDMLKIGLLFLQQGLWNSHRIVSPRWLEETATIRYKPGDGYGYLWWLPESFPDYHPIMAAGGGGQEIFVFTELKMAVVFTAGCYDDDSGYTKATNILKSAVLPSFNR